MPAVIVTGKYATRYELIREIKRMHARGYSQARISFHTKVSPRTISRLVKEINDG